MERAYQRRVLQFYEIPQPFMEGNPSIQRLEQKFPLTVKEQEDEEETG